MTGATPLVRTPTPRRGDVVRQHAPAREFAVVAGQVRDLRRLPRIGVTSGPISDARHRAEAGLGVVRRPPPERAAGGIADKTTTASSPSGALMVTMIGRSAAT